MAALVIVELHKTEQLALQVTSSPKRYEVEILSPDRPDEPLVGRNNSIGDVRLPIGTPDAACRRPVLM